MDKMTLIDANSVSKSLDYPLKNIPRFTSFLNPTVLVTE